MSAIRSKLYRLETRIGELHQCINDKNDLEYREHTGRNEPLTEHLAILENLIDRLSISRRNNGIPNGNRLANVLAESRDHIRNSDDESIDSALSAHHLSSLSQLVSMKACIQTVAAALEVFSENVICLDEEIRYWEDVLRFDWRVGLYALQTSPFKVWQKCFNSHHFNNRDAVSSQPADNIAGEMRLSSALWLRFYTSVQRCLAPISPYSRVGIFPSLSAPKLEIQRKKKKLQALRDFNASAIGLLIEECLSSEPGIPMADSDEIADRNLFQSVQSSVGLLGHILQNAQHDIDLFEQSNNLVGDDGNTSSVAQCDTEIDSFDIQGVFQELIHILTDSLPQYKQALAVRISESGRPSAAVRYWIPFSLAIVTGTTSLKIARDVGPVVMESISNLGATAIDFWKNWVIDPMWKLVRTIRHDEKSEIALMSRNSLEADRASLERMVVDFVLDRSEHNQPDSYADVVADKVREGDLTPVLRAYEKDLRSPFMGTIRGDLVRALLIQIQKTKVDVEVAMSGIDALLKSQELVFGFVGLTPGLLISYGAIRWFFGLIGSRRGFRLGRRQDDLRYALRKIHRILSFSTLTGEGRLTPRNHGLLICNAEILLNKGQTMLKGEDLHAFREDSCDLINESQAEKQLQIVERMAWTYSKWT
ncbi:ATP synthase regulation protein NCA2-domain-containing protein [Aspergillus unguis]